MRNDLPSGTVTFLFTDMEGSTKLLHELGPEDYTEALAEHRRLLRNAFTLHGGVEVDTQGDAFFYAFPTARGALAAAHEGQRALERGPIRVRIGIHTGTAHLTGEGYVGADVNKGARIAAAGHGGQVLLSKETDAAVKDAAVKDVDLEVTDLGEHRVKDFDSPVWILQLGSDRFPPLKTISNTNLPTPASSFVGRQREVSEVTALLRGDARLVTLSGPGGTGKTRVAIDAGSELVPEFRNGVFWVGLANLSDPALVLDEIAQAIGANDDIISYVSDREMLLVIDNLEQVIDAAPELSPLLAACPNLRILVTSRELLRIQGEVEYPVPPLDETEAVQLFCARSGLSADTTIKELCRRLDNLPLAVELASARTGVLTPEKILERLSKRLDLFRGRRDADPRQSTLRATIEWSHDLLSDEEKELFARLAVFRGGCTLETAEEVAGAHLDALQALVDKSLVRHTEGRFWMLETIRAYAVEMLEKSGREAEHGLHHAKYFVAFAEEAASHLEGNAARWLDIFEVEHDNIRAALDRLEASKEIQLAQGLAGTLSVFWEMRGHYSEGRRRLEALVAADQCPTAARARALTGACAMSVAFADFSTAKLRGSEALTIYRSLGDERGIATSQLELGVAFAGESAWEKARHLLKESAERFEKIGDERMSVWATRMLAWTRYEMGDHAEARALHEKNLARARAVGNQFIEASTLGALGGYAATEGRTEDAFRLLEEGIRMNQELRSLESCALDLCRVAYVLAQNRRLESAARLMAFSEAAHEDLGVNFDGWVMSFNNATMDAIHAGLDEGTLAEVWEQGRNLTLDEAVELAFERLS